MLVRKQKHSKRGEPVFTGVVTAGDVGQRGGCVFIRGSRQDLPSRIACGKRGRDAAHTPRTAEIQAIEMHKLGITAIGDNRRLQQSRGTTLRDVRQEPVKPCGKFRRFHDTTHQVGFHERGGKEILTARLPAG